MRDFQFLQEQAYQYLRGKILNDELEPEQIDVACFESCLYTAGIPDPDLIIRPSGELRSSNFLLWQSAYAEFYTTPVLWPDFGREDLFRAISDYQSRSRRFGGLEKR